MSFLIDPPWLAATGAAIEVAAPDEKTARRLESGVLALFLAVSISLYLDLGWVRWLWKLCRAESGRDWMLNSGVFHIDWRRSRLPTHLAAVALFCTYPLAIRAGRRAAAHLKSAR